MAAEALLSAVLDVLLGRLASPEVLNFFRDNRPVVAKLVKKLNVTLLSANALLNDAEDKQVKDSSIKGWVDMLNDVLFEADNVVDEINTEVARHEIKDKSCLRGLVPNSFNKFEKAIKIKIETVIEGLDLLLDQKDRLGLREGVQSKRIERSPAPLILDSSDVYGRNGDREDIVQLLLSVNDGGSDKLSVIPIVGMGGLGKTTLARLVYNDKRVKNHFEQRAWVVVSDDFHVLRLAKLVFEGLAGKKSKSTELGKLQEEIELFLRGKKFLLVLDDVWNENYNLWNALKCCLTLGEDGSKIIVTTRDEKIGSMMGTVPSHRLKTMSDEDCWELFSKHAFNNVEADVFRELENICRAIVKKCKGLPLAVMSLAGLLCSVSDPNEWEEILKSDVWDLHKKGNDEILPSLWLSYSYLPSHLKRCFAYCSIFPKDFEYEKKSIILLWMAEGLLQGENMEDVGEEYFKSLISRSLFQRSVKKESSVVMHDLVHDLATFVLGKGLCILWDKDDNLRSFSSKTRHLLFDDNIRESRNFDAFSKGKCLRTFLALPETRYSYHLNIEVMLKEFKCLRVLCLLRSSMKKVPESIRKLKHLRYLDLSGTDIKRLPNTICSLYNLQTLLLRRCRKLTELPANMGSLINLRHLDISLTSGLKKMPLRNWSLKGLRTLTKLVLNDERDASKMKELRQYYPDGSFEIVGLENVKDVKDVLDAEFEKQSGITELTLDWCAGSSNLGKDKAILDALKPHVSLRELKIQGYGGTELSDWVRDDSFSNKTKVWLFNMDRLQSWSLFTDVLAFRCLKELWLWKCPQMETLQMNNTAFPSLTKLKINGCPKLEFSGLPLPSSLEELRISDCKLLLAQRMQWGLSTTLKELGIGKCGDMESFPEEGLVPTTLKELNIVDAPNLKALNGKALQHLTSLVSLYICNCPKLECLPEERLPASLYYFIVEECNPVLEGRLKRGTVEDWYKISHISDIYVNSKRI